MIPTPIRLLIVNADPGAEVSLQNSLAEMQDIEILGVARNKLTAVELVETTEADVILVDVMLTGYGGIELISFATAKQPDCHILALTPGNPPHDRVILAIEAGAAGYITRNVDDTEALAAIKQVHKGRPWLPLDETLEVLQEAAPELAVSAQERSDRLTQVILGLVSLTGLVAALTGLLWREYWKDIGVRVVDLGIDPTNRMIDVVVFFLLLVGLFGSLLFVDNWLQEIGTRTSSISGVTKTINKGQGIRLIRIPLGKLLFNHTIAWIMLAAFVLIVMGLVYQLSQLIIIMFIGPLVGIILLANIVGMAEELPAGLRISSRGLGRVIVVISMLLILVFSILSFEVFVAGPDLRPDGVHGILAPEVLGLSAIPVRLFDLDTGQDLFEVLYLGGNADLYVLYDPCTDEVRLIPVGSSRLTVIDQVTCRGP